GGRAHREHLVPGAGDAVGPGGVHVVGVLPDEVDVGRLVQAGAGGGVLVVVAEGQGPGDAAVLHRPHHVVQRLLRLQGGAGGAVDDVAVEEDDVGPDVIEHRVLQCDRATVGARTVLGVVELDDGEGAVLTESQLTAHDAVLGGGALDPGRGGSGRSRPDGRQTGRRRSGGGAQEMSTGRGGGRGGGVHGSPICGVGAGTRTANTVCRPPR